jgi:hypothetical protein
VLRQSLDGGFGLAAWEGVHVPMSPTSPTSPLSPGTLLTLQGAGAYDAAVHCASVSAARRLAQERRITGAIPAGLQGSSSARYLNLFGQPMKQSA